MELPKEFLLSDLLNLNVKGNAIGNYGNGENVWKLNQINQIIDNDIFIKGNPAISDIATLNRFPSLIAAKLVNSEGSKIGVIADFLFEMKTGNIKFYLISRSNPRIPGSSRWKLNIEDIIDQQPGLVFSSCSSLEDLSLIRSSLKYEFLKKGKKIIDRFDDMKNTATNRLEDWLEEDEDINQKTEFDQNIFYNEEEKARSFRNKREDDPWI